MSSNNIIELSQNATGSFVKANGDYQVTITDRIMLNEGDSVVMNRCFLDTTASGSNKIDIDKDTTITIGFNQWVMDNITGNKQWYGQMPRNDAAKLNLDQCYNGRATLRCVLSDLAKGEIVSIGMVPSSLEFTYGDGISFTINYTNVSGVATTYHGKLDTVQLGNYPLGYTQSLGPLYYQDGTTPTITVSDLVKAGIKQPTLGTAGGGNNDVFEPITYTKSITIPQGKYAPEELGSFISERMQLAYGEDSITLNSIVPTNNLLQQANITDYYVYDPEIQGTQGIGLGLNPIYFSYTNTNNYVGTSQFAVEYDQDFNKFKFTFLHTPYYSPGVNGANGDIICTFGTSGANIVDGGLNLKNKPFLISSYSGIFLTSLQPTTFWEDKLGIVPADICYNASYYTQNNGVGGIYELPSFSWEPGTKTTTGELLVNGLVQKNANFFSPPNLVNQTPIVIQNTIEVVATNQILQDSIDTAYYLVEINTTIQNQFHDSFNNYRNIMAIIGTYYSLNSFTTGTDSDSLVYQHTGSPVQLSSFGIRILKDNKQVASSLLGENNSVFLQIIRAADPTQDQMLSLSKLAKKEKEEEK